MICKNKGYSLIETLVVIFIFLFILVVIFNIYISSIRQQRYNLTTQQLIDQMSYSLEYIERFARMAQKDATGACLGTAGKNYLAESQSLKFVNYRGECQRFYLYNGQIYQDISNSAGPIPGLNGSTLTSSKFIVTAFDVVVSGDNPGDVIQPRISLLIEIQEKSAVFPKTKIQATISQRNLDK